MQKCEIQSYRVFFFEKQGDEFYKPPEAYPREALACVGIHDLPPLAGWWSGHDLALRARIGLLPEGELPEAVRFRAHQRRRALGLLAEKGLMPADMAPVLRAEREAPERSSRTARGRLPPAGGANALPAVRGASRRADRRGRAGEHPRHRRRASELAAKTLRRSGRAAQLPTLSRYDRSVKAGAAETRLSDPTPLYAPKSLLCSAPIRGGRLGESSMRRIVRLYRLCSFSFRPFSSLPQHSLKNDTLVVTEGADYFGADYDVRKDVDLERARPPARTTRSARPSPTTPPPAGAS